MLSSFDFSHLMPLSLLPYVTDASVPALTINDTLSLLVLDTYLSLNLTSRSNSLDIFVDTVRCTFVLSLR
jgi:hypothetical protein